MSLSNSPPKVVCVVGSLRSQAGILPVPNVGSLNEAYKYIMSLGDISASNSWYMGMMALMGAASVGCNTLMVHADDVKAVENIDQATGVLWSTPVYFGMASSSIIRTLSILDNMKATKVMGVLSVGAKRNGGQETTNINTLQLGLSKGFILVGNGPPISQYGGTAVAGVPKAVLNDDYGLHSAFDTGRQVGIASKILGTAPDKTFNPSTIKIQDLLGQKIRSCRACVSCPGMKKSDYKCVIKDGMENIFRKMAKADIFVVDCIHFDPVYRQFVERCRFIRRDDFRLSYKVFTTSLDDPFHQTHVIINWIRQGAYIFPPFLPKPLEEFTQKIVSAGKGKILPATAYIPIGHDG